MLSRFASALACRATVACAAVRPAVCLAAVPRTSFGVQRLLSTAASYAGTSNTAAAAASPSTASPSPFAPSGTFAADANSQSASLGLDAAVAASSATHIDNFEMSAPIRAALKQNFKIEHLFPIQAECYPPITQGLDVIGRSKTGSGKTLAFVLPVIQRLKQFPPLKAPVSSTGRYSSYVQDCKCRVLILEPTRELANQVNMEILKLAHVKTAVLYGGAPSHEQARQLGRGSDVVVATPGRLLDMVQRGVLSLDEVKTVVLDEADEMLRMGFQEQVEQIMAHMQQQKQVLLFSATLPTWVNKTASRYLKNPILVDKITGFANTTPSTITHKAIAVTRMLPDTAELLRDIFESQDVKRAIIFSRTKRDCGAIADMLGNLGIRSRELHGDVPQMARDRTMSDFRSGRFLALVATDVAARGLDIANVDMVVNIGFPDDHAFYVHRSGRTGRAGKKGVSLLLYQQEERSKIHELTKEIGAKFEQFALPASFNGKDYPRRSLLSAKRGFTTIEVRGRRVDPMALEQQLRQLTGNANISVGRVESADESSFTDVANDVAAAIEAALLTQPNASIRIAPELPESMFGGQRVTWGAGRGGGAKRGGSSSGGNRRTGGYGNSRGGDRGSGRGVDSYKGGRSRDNYSGSSSTYGNRESSSSSYGNRESSSYGGNGAGRYGNSGSRDY